MYVQHSSHDGLSARTASVASNLTADFVNSASSQSAAAQRFQTNLVIMSLRVRLPAGQQLGAASKKGCTRQHPAAASVGQAAEAASPQSDPQQAGVAALASQPWLGLACRMAVRRAPLDSPQPPTHVLAVGGLAARGP